MLSSRSEGNFFKESKGMGKKERKMIPTEPSEPVNVTNSSLSILRQLQAELLSE